MDLQRFVTMLVSSALRFTKAAEFGDDPWEGFCKVIVPSTAIPKKREDGTIYLESVQQLQASPRKIIRQVPHGSASSPVGELLEFGRRFHGPVEDLWRKWEGFGNSIFHGPLSKILAL
jgi:hypothetical protein